MFPPNRKPLPTPRGFSLIELLIVVTLMGILTAAILPRFEPSIVEQLESAAHILASDLDYARSLAVGNGSRYRVTFDPLGARYVVEHNDAAKPALDALPHSPFHRPGDPSDQYIVEFSRMPQLGASVQIAGVRTTGSVVAAVSDLEFNALGSLTRSEPTEVWLASGHGAARRYLPVQVDPVTGLATVGELVATRPATITN